jgi:hypothetical protein
LDKHVAKETRNSVPIIVLYAIVFFFLLLFSFLSWTVLHLLTYRGDSGSGKSALLANWSLRYQEHHPENVVITIFVGCSSSSVHYGSLMHRVMVGLADIFEMRDVEIPDSSVRNES